MKYKLVIFDMDGTILNTLEDLTDSTNATLEHFGYPVHSIEDVRHFVGNGIRKLIERAVPSGLSTERIDEVYRYFLDYYAKHCADKTKPYDGILDLIRTLRKEGCKTAVVSNEAVMAVQELCKDYFDGLFDFAVGEREGVRRKPAPDAVEHVLDTLQITKKDAVYIGDSEVDVQTAINAGLDSVIVLWGFRERELLEQYGAKVFAQDTKECLRLLQ